jgi:steroid delta-isomerase-like uncharacterized protein
MSTTRTDRLETVRAHMEAEDRQDVEATLATFTEDCWYSVPSLGMELRGKHEIGDWYRSTFAAVPDFHNLDERTWVAEDGTVFYSASMAGTMTGEWAGWAPTGKSFSVPMLVRIPIAADALLEAEVVYLDAATLFMQLGILPERGTRQERAMQRLHGLRMRAAERLRRR